MPFDNSTYQPTDPVLKCLQDARQWLSDPAHWCKGAEARDRWGGWVVATSSRVSATCSWGAVKRATGADNYRVSGPAADLLRGGIYDLGQYNDHPTTEHADVLDLFDRAIAARLSELLASQSQVGS